jgi:hypothetical protein
MPIRQIMPEPYQLTVYPMQRSPATNTLGNKTRELADTPVTRGATSLRDASTREIINPAFIDRVVTRIHLATLHPQDWADGDRVAIPVMGTYQVEGDPEMSNQGPLTAINHMFGGMVRLKRVS